MRQPFLNELLRGSYQVQPVITPAAGAEFSYITEAIFNYEWLYIVANLTTDANVANRAAHLHIWDGTTDIFFVNPQRVQTAGTSVIYSGSQQGGDRSAVGTTVNYWCIPIRNILRPYTYIDSLTDNMQAGDQWDGIRIYLLRCAYPGPI